MLIKLPRVDMFFVCRGGGGGGGGGVGGCRSGGSGGSGWWWVVVGGGGWWWVVAFPIEALPSALDTEFNASLVMLVDACGDDGGGFHGSGPRPPRRCRHRPMSSL